MKKRTRKQKVTASQKRFEKQPTTLVQSLVQTRSNQVKSTPHLRADLTKTLWLTILAVGTEIALWYLWR